jgi:hypothetical protein
MSESDKSFTVSDRRHFTPDGRPRDENGEEAAGALPREEAPSVGPKAPPAVGPKEPPAGPADFSQFLLGLAAQVGMLLSEPPGAPGVPPEEALEAARSIISILEMLKDKTEGRRTPAEEALLADLLFQVRMAYVAKTRAGGA